MNTLGQDRLKNPYLEASNRGEFVHRLRAASKGQLREPEDMKPVQRRIPGASLFELRWQGINRVIPDHTSHGRRESVLLRLYFGEPEQFGRSMIGLHCHVKDVTGHAEHDRAIQNQEIEKALQCFTAGMPMAWGIDALKDPPNT